MQRKLFQYGDREISYLSQKDKKLGVFIKRTGFVERYIFSDMFKGLCFNIINQQLSMKAANTLFSKIQTRIGNIAPENLKDSQKLISCGLSQKKAECIALCAKKFSSGEISAEKLSEMNDEAIMSSLSNIRGIGAWTAEMTLIFCLGRPDILSLSDYGIRKGISLLHNTDIKNICEMQKYKKLYSPYGTTASIYLWKAAEVLSSLENKKEDQNVK